MKDEVRPLEEQVPELPNADLMFRVAGTSEADWFWSSGRTSVQNFNSLLSVIGKSLADFPRALEFGCGCGRILLHLQDVGEKNDLYGVDIDAEAIAWAQQHVPWARLSVNQGLPPLDFPDETFDLIFNQSVFTHLDENYQDAWLVELERVTKPGGVLILSVSGEHPFTKLEKSWRDVSADPTPLRNTIRDKGFLFIQDDSWVNGPFPDFYHSTFHAPWYVFERWGSIFDIKAYVVRGSLDFQDQVLLVRRKQVVKSVAPLRNLSSQLAQAKERIAMFQEALVQGKQQVQTAEESARQWRTTADATAATLRQVLGSRSWRLTAPLRNLFSRFRSMR